MNKDLVSILDLTKEDADELFRIVNVLKNPGIIDYSIPRKSLAFISEKPSARTRLSFEVAMTQLGGHTIHLGPDDIGLGKRESIHDIAKTVSRMTDAIAARTFKHNTVLKLAKHADIPVINALSDEEHPCQALADFLTIKECFGRTNIKLAYIGDGNNVCHSLMLLGALLGTDMHIACPGDYLPKQYYVHKSTYDLYHMGGAITLTDINCAVENANVIYTDTWTSMGQEDKKEERRKIFAPYQVDKELLKNAHPNHQVMHCLPAHRGEEITDEVMDDKQHSLIWKQAENRLHIAKALLYKMLSK